LYACASSDFGKQQPEMVLTAAAEPIHFLPGQIAPKPGYQGWRIIVALERKRFWQPWLKWIA